MEIKKQYCVDGQCFDTRAEAEAYVENNADLKSIEAFAEYKRANGAQRVNTAIIEEYLAWKKKQDKAATVEEQPNTPESVDQTPAEEPVPETEEENTPPFEPDENPETPAEEQKAPEISSSLFG